MTDYLVKRLRYFVGQYIGDADIDDELSGAADRIEQLEAALREIAWSRKGGPLRNKLAEKYEKIAIEALEGKDD